MEGLDAAICADCVEAASGLVEEGHQRPDDARSDGRTDISRYPPDAEIALLIGEAALRHHRFVPLAASSSQIAIAVTGLENYHEIRTVVREAVAHAVGSRRSAETMNLVWADQEAILEKISQVFNG